MEDGEGGVLRRLDVAGDINGVVGHRVCAVGHHEEGRGVGLQGSGVDLVHGRGYAGKVIGRGQGDLDVGDVGAVHQCAVEGDDRLWGCRVS